MAIQLLRVHARCKHLVRTLPTLPVAPNDPEDVDTNAEDHPFDGLKMALLANPPTPEQPARLDREDENRHPGFILHTGGPNPTLLRRHRPKKPFQEQIEGWPSRYGVSRGPFGRYPPPGGPMEPWLEEM